MLDFLFGGWELDQRNRSKKTSTFFGIFVILDRMQLQITCTYKERRLAFLFQLSCLDITGKGTVELEDMENYSSSKAHLFLQRVVKTSNDNNRHPKARNYF